MLAAQLLSCVTTGCSSPARGGEEIRMPAPDFALSDVQNRLIRISDFKGKVVVLDFWATWCGPCRAEIPWFNDLARRYRDRGLVVLGVSMDEKGWTAVVPFVKDLQVEYPVVLASAAPVQAYGVGPPPTTFLIDRRERISDVCRAGEAGGFRECSGGPAGGSQTRSLLD